MYNALGEIIVEVQGDGKIGGGAIQNFGLGGFPPSLPQWRTLVDPTPLVHRPLGQLSIVYYELWTYLPFNYH